MSFGFTKTFRLIAMVLLVCVMQVYVLAHPRATDTTNATKNTEAVNKPVVTDHQLNFIKQNQVTSQSQLASERSITFAPKSPLSLAFTKASVEKAATKTTFLKVKKGTYDLMLSPNGQSTTDSNDDGDDDGDHKALIVASAIVIGAAVAAFIGFRHDRDDDNIRGQ
jgi:competence protein ComGC